MRTATSSMAFIYYYFFPFLKLLLVKEDSNFKTQAGVPKSKLASETFDYLKGSGIVDVDESTVHLRLL